MKFKTSSVDAATGGRRGKGLMGIDAATRARIWQTSAVFDPETQRAAAEIGRDPEALMACFGQELEFGTGGLRGILGVGTNRMNPYTVAKATQGLAFYLLAAGGSKVAVAYDSRNKSREFAGIVAGVLAYNGIQAWVFDEMAPTPMLSFAVRELRCDAGVVITASHNPAQYNGYKVYGADGCQIVDEAAEAITASIEKLDYTSLAWLSEDEAKNRGMLRTIPPEIYDAFIEKTLACRVQGCGRRPRLRLVYTSLHGAGLAAARSVFSRMPGIEFMEVREQCVPDGNFPTCPRPNPELEEALELATACARREGADLVLASDPDCDRVGVAVRRGQDFQVLSGNEVGLLLTEYILANRPRSSKPPVVVKTIVTSDLTEKIANAYGAQVVEVLTGFKYIGRVIGDMEIAGEADRFAFGFEESCGYLAGTHVRDKDGVMALMLVAEMAQHHAAAGKTLAQAMEALYDAYGRHGSRLISIDIPGALPMRRMKEIMDRLRAEPPKSMGGNPVVGITDYATGIGGLPPSNVLSLRNAADAKVIIRPSGTEPKVKAYLSAKGQDAQTVERVLDMLAAQVKEWLS